MATVQSWQQHHRSIYGAIALLSLPTVLGLVLSPTPGLAQSTAPLECLCEAVPEDDNFQCLLDQGSRLNRAKNLARQRGESANGGISLIETEPSMHGPAAESPYSIMRVNGSVRYIFTFRVRPRATQNYTHESQIAVNYAVENDEWTVDTLYNRSISPIAISYSEETTPNQREGATCDVLVPRTN
ncbi:MAG: hypothetical protein F6K30_10655 [Cyanothece sp. SIO2G6]|nr:hypothetical protein [Cyanothece sp. SIO2G6]